MKQLVRGFFQMQSKTYGKPQKKIFGGKRKPKVIKPKIKVKKGF